MEKLNLIQFLRLELTKLNEKRNINEKKIEELDELYKNNDIQLKELKVELYNTREEFYDKKSKKYLLLTTPVGIVCSIIIFFVWNHNFIPNGLSDYVISTGISGLTLITFMASSYYLALNNKLDKILIKIFPKLQIYCDKITLLKNNITKIIDEIENIIAHQNTLNFSNHSISEEIQEKKQQLDKLTNDYFYNIENNHLMDKKDNTYITQENKGKIRVRTPENI